MTISELNAALDIQRRINRLQASLDTLHETGGIGSAVSSEPVMGGVSRDTGQIAVEISDELSELKRQLEIEQVVIRRRIEKIELSGTEQKLLLLRYVLCMPWKSVGMSMAYSRSVIFDMHKKIVRRILSES